MLKRSKEPKKEPHEITYSFFNHAITEKILDLASEYTNGQLTDYYKNTLVPTLKLAKSLAVKSTLGMFSDEDGRKLFNTNKAKALLIRLEIAFKEKDDV